jgi:hypothetical protein
MNCTTVQSFAVASMLHGLLTREGLGVGHKHVASLMRLLGGGQ